MLSSLSTKHKFLCAISASITSLFEIYAYPINLIMQDFRKGAGFLSKVLRTMRKEQK